MRALIVGCFLSASVALAQPVPGVWSGYVNGWVSDAQHSGSLALGFNARHRVPRLTLQQQQVLVLQSIAAQQAFVTQQNYVQLQQVAAQQQEQLAQQQALATQQRQYEYERSLGSEAQLLAQQQQLAVQQQLLAQQQQQAAAEELARVAERESKVKLVEAEQKLLAEREAARQALARAEADAKPREKGPDIHRWVDDDGVVHYSTRPHR